VSDDQSLVQRLREVTGRSHKGICHEAADRIQELEELNEELRVRWDNCLHRIEELKVALREIRSDLEYRPERYLTTKTLDIARRALEGKS
jgi:hypothetical protein